MIKFEVIQHGDVWRIVDKLAALVEKRAVVLVALNHKSVFEFAQPVPHGRILRHTADQETRISSVGPQEKRCQ